MAASLEWGTIAGAEPGSGFEHKLFLLPVDKNYPDYAYLVWIMS
jgi:hypothetical protein